MGKKMKLLLLELYCGFLMQDEGGNMILYHCQLGFFQLLDLLYLICQERIFDLLELMLLGNKFWYLKPIQMYLLFYHELLVKLLLVKIL